MESYYTFRIAYIEAYKTQNAFGKIILPDESDIEREYEFYLLRYKEEHGQPSQTDSLIVANLRAHLEALNNEYAEAMSEDDSFEHAKLIRNKILLLEEILKLEKPIV